MALAVANSQIILCDDLQGACNSAPVNERNEIENTEKDLHTSDDDSAMGIQCEKSGNQKKVGGNVCSSSSDDEMHSIQVRKKIKNAPLKYFSDSDENFSKVEETRQEIILRSQYSSEEEDSTNIKMKKKRKRKFQRISKVDDDSLDSSCPVTENNNSKEDMEQQLDGLSSEVYECQTKVNFKELCDSSSDDNSNSDNEKEISLNKLKSSKSSLEIEKVKHIRISAKQAMENKQKIKSESNRMLREKEVSLPYHRPKALSLKDIMSRRKPATAFDGKILPIKMTNEQLKHYALQLERRQQEVIKLCKSDSEDEEIEKESMQNDNIVTVKYHTVPVDLPEVALGPKDSIAEETCADDIVKVNKYDILNVIEDKIVNVIEDNNISVIDDNIVNVIEDNIISVINDKITNVIEDNIVNVIEDNIVNVIEDNILNVSNDNILNVIDDNIVNPIEDKIINVNKDNIVIEDKIVNVNKDNIVIEDKIVNDEENKKDMISENKNNSKRLEIGDLRSDEINSVSKNDIITLNDELLQENNTKCDNDSNKNKSDENSNDIEKDDKKCDKVLKEDTPSKDDLSNIFGDEDMDIPNIDSVLECIENGDGKATSTFIVKPELKGEPGMVINLSDNDPIKQRTGLELLKEKFTYFSNIKTPEELERQKERRIKPGSLLLKLKQELEDQMAMQRSLEWSKRLEQEKQEQNNMQVDEDLPEDNKLLDDKSFKLSKEEKDEESVNETTDEEIEDTEETGCEILKAKERNVFIDDETEVDDDEESINGKKDGVESINNETTSQEDSDDETSSDSDVEEESKTQKKKRILKAFEDSDDEKEQEDMSKNNEITNVNNMAKDQLSQDDDIPLAQQNKSHSEDLFSSEDMSQEKDKNCTIHLETILSPINQCDNIIKNYSRQNLMDTGIVESMNRNGRLDKSIENLTIVCESQPNVELGLDDIVGMCSGSFSQNIVPNGTQEFGDELLSLCTGKFYDNQFVKSQETDLDENVTIKIIETKLNGLKNIETDTPVSRTLTVSDLDADNQDLNDKENEQNKLNIQNNRKFVIESDDEDEQGDKRQVKTKKKSKTALMISDDEEEYSEESDIDENDICDEIDKIVEYDSEENEVEIEPKKQKRRATDFFENEAELSSEDEWIGSGDEDEAGLDVMEREEGDSDTFHQGKLQKELGQIHLREVMDQDKREVRILQELLFEDGDLGDGHRQRKFRWKNTDGEELLGTTPDEFSNTQEEDFESEEQWRKQRHEREVFLRNLDTKGNESFNTSITRNTIIKANLKEKTMSSLLLEVSSTKIESNSESLSVSRITSKDLDSPVKEPFSLFQKQYRSSLLGKGNSTLARLAALAGPIASESQEEQPKNLSSLAPGKKRNFVFASITPKEKNKVQKRRADSSISSPQLLKKLKNKEENKCRNSLLDHFNT